MSHKVHGFQMPGSKSLSLPFFFSPLGSLLLSVLKIIEINGVLSLPGSVRELGRQDLSTVNK